MVEWNGLVDEYIATGKDIRPRIDIERMSKIGVHGGPLYRQCEADGCDRYEGIDIQTLKHCAGCKLVSVFPFLRPVSYVVSR